MSIYTGVGSSARALNKLYVGVGGQARQVTKAYVGVGGQARLIYNYGTPLGDLAVGSIVQILVNGGYYNFFVAHQGNPNSSIYDSSCNGTWLMASNVFTTTTQYTPYSRTDSPLYVYFNTTFLNSMESSVKNAVKQVIIPYAETRYKLHQGANGVSIKVFAPSYYELCGDTNASIGVDGAPLSYFSSGSSTRRIVAGADYWTRSILNKPFCVDSTGAIATDFVYNKHGARPMFILPSSLTIDPDTRRIQA